MRDGCIPCKLGAQFKESIRCGQCRMRHGHHLHVDTKCLARKHPFDRIWTIDYYFDRIILLDVRMTTEDPPSPLCGTRAGRWQTLSAAGRSQIKSVLLYCVDTQLQPTV
eukprot:scaffold896_cov58-Attheya_sp.AAC.8